MIIDLHMHSSASDGTDSPEALIDIAIKNNIKIFSLTDHDNINGVKRIEAKVNAQNPSVSYADSSPKVEPREIRTCLPFRGGVDEVDGGVNNIKFIRGVELSCIAKNGKCHILGFNYDYENEKFKNVLKIAEDLRHTKLERRLKFLNSEFGIKFNENEINELKNNSGSGKPHLANLIVEHGFADNKNDAIKNYINKISTGNTRVDAKLAIEAVLSAGGVPVWAHPFGGEGEPEISREKLILTLEELKSYGLKGLECYYSKYNTERREYLAELAVKNNLLISAGSDYHGLNKKIALGIEVSNPDKITVLEAIL